MSNVQREKVRTHSGGGWRCKSELCSPDDQSHKHFDQCSSCLTPDRGNISGAFPKRVSARLPCVSDCVTRAWSLSWSSFCGALLTFGRTEAFADSCAQQMQVMTGFSHCTKMVPVKSHNVFSRYLIEKGVVWLNRNPFCAVRTHFYHASTNDRFCERRVVEWVCSWPMQQMKHRRRDHGAWASQWCEQIESLIRLSCLHKREIDSPTSNTNEQVWNCFDRKRPPTTLSHQQYWQISVMSWAGRLLIKFCSVLPPNPKILKKMTIVLEFLV